MWFIKFSEINSVFIILNKIDFSKVKTGTKFLQWIYHKIIFNFYRILEVLGKCGEEIASDAEFSVSKHNFALSTKRIQKTQSKNVIVSASSTTKGQLKTSLSPSDDGKASITIPSSILTTFQDEKVSQNWWWNGNRCFAIIWLPFKMKKFLL